jgi:hypothetical protein
MLPNHILPIRTILHNPLLHRMLHTFPRSSWRVYYLEQQIRHDTNIRTKHCYLIDSFALAKAVLVLSEKIACSLAVWRP